MARIIRSWWEEITGVSTFLSLGILKRFIYSILSYPMHGSISDLTRLHRHTAVSTKVVPPKC